LATVSIGEGFIADKIVGYMGSATDAVLRRETVEASAGP
jgi:hypothetical protein